MFRFFRKQNSGGRKSPNYYAPKQKCVACGTSRNLKPGHKLHNNCKMVQRLRKEGYL
jgi:hypothetical protein